MRREARRNWRFSAIEAGAFAAAGALATACSGGATPAPPGTAAPLAIVPDATVVRPAGTLDAVVLYDPSIEDPYSDTATFTATDRTGATLAGARWTSSQTSLEIDPTANPATSYQTDVPTPPPHGIAVYAASHGRADLTATSGSATATLPVFAYPSVDIGCDIRATAGVSFDPDAASSAPSSASDVYVSAAGSGPYCPMPPGTPEPDYVFHFPYGATFVTNGTVSGTPAVAGAQSGPSFPFAPTSLWRNDYTAVDETTLASLTAVCTDPATHAGACITTPASVILFKTSEGRVVKLLATGLAYGTIFGAYEVSDLSGAFPF